jgi:predicted nucleic acid-binding protein
VIVVADAGPLLHLAGIGQLDLIRRLSTSVLVPETIC